MNAPLVLLHGYTGGPASWDPLIALLPAGPPVIRETLVGSVASDSIPRSELPRSAFLTR